MASAVAARALSARPRMAATKAIFSARPRTATTAAAPKPPIDFLQPEEKFWFDYFKFDSLQFEKRVNNDVALLKKLKTAKTSFSHKDYQSYYVPKFAATKPRSPTALRKLFEVHPFPTSNPFLLAFLQPSLTVDKSSEFYGITVTPEDVRFHLWEDLIRHVVQRKQTTLQ